MPAKLSKTAKTVRGTSTAHAAATQASTKLAPFAVHTPEANTAADATSIMLSAEQLAAEFAKQRTTLRDDFLSLIQESNKPLQASLDSLQATVNSFQSRLASVESTAGDNFARITTAESTIKALHVQNQSLLDRVDDLENRSRRANLRVLNIPEGSEDGKDPLKFMSEMLAQMMGPDVFSAPPELERAHRTPTYRPAGDHQGKNPLVCFSRFQQKEAALRWARNHELKFQGAAIRVYQDLSTTLAKRRAAFNGIKQALYRKNVRFQHLYPSRLRVVHDNDTHIFDSPDEAQKFYDQKIGKG